MTSQPRPTYPLSEPELDALYLRLAGAYRRMEQRRAARLTLPLGEGRGEGETLVPETLVPETLTITQPAPLVPPSGRRGPYRPRRPVGVTTAGRA